MKSKSCSAVLGKTEECSLAHFAGINEFSVSLFAAHLAALLAALLATSSVAADLLPPRKEGQVETGYAAELLEFSSRRSRFFGLTLEIIRLKREGKLGVKLKMILKAN